MVAAWDLYIYFFDLYHCKAVVSGFVVVFFFSSFSFFLAAAVAVEQIAVIKCLLGYGGVVLRREV